LGRVGQRLIALRMDRGRIVHADAGSGLHHNLMQPGSPTAARFVADSPLEERGFEPSVPGKRRTVTDTLPWLLRNVSVAEDGI